MSNLDNLREQRPGNRENIASIKEPLLNAQIAHQMHEQSGQIDSPGRDNKNQAPPPA